MHFIVPCPFKPFLEHYQPESEQQFFMQCAYNEALKAWALGEIPIGAIAVREQQIVARSHNLVETKQDATCHAEMELLRQLASQQRHWRLNEITIYVTKEPCPMCAGAFYKSRIPKVVIGLHDPFQGCLGGRIHFNTTLRLYHTIEVILEPIQGACETLITTFFQLRRKVRSEEAII